MKFTVAIAQIHPRPGDLEANLQAHLQSAKDAAAQGARCVVFPEMSLTGYHLPGGYATVALTREHDLLKPLFDFSANIDILFGLVIESQDHRIYNASLYLSGGRMLSEHRKIYLPTYGAFEEGKYFARGESISAFDTAAGRAGVLICEENWHPSAAYVLWVDDAVVLYSLHCSSVKPNSLDAPGSSAAICRQLNQFYAKMFGCYFVFANRVGEEGAYHFWGGSEIVDPFGAVEKRAKTYEPELLLHTIDTDKIRQARLALPLRRDEDVHLTLRNLTRLARSPDQ
jgi:predicted amidohydrolase